MFHNSMIENASWITINTSKYLDQLRNYKHSSAEGLPFSFVIHLA